MTRIWKVYGRGIWYYISGSFPGDTLTCDDCFQETMLKIYKGLGSYSISRPLKPWIYRIAHNCCQDMIRQKEEAGADYSALLSAADSVNHEEVFVRDELVRAIEKSICGLDADDSRIAYLRFFEGMKFREIADVTGINENSVKTRMSAVKRKLRSELKEWL